MWVGARDERVADQLHEALSATPVRALLPAMARPMPVVSETESLDGLRQRTCARSTASTWSSSTATARRARSVTADDVTGAVPGSRLATRRSARSLGVRAVALHDRVASTRCRRPEALERALDAGATHLVVVDPVTGSVVGLVTPLRRRARTISCCAATTTTTTTSRIHAAAHWDLATLGSPVP